MIPSNVDRHGQAPPHNFMVAFILFMLAGGLTVTLVTAFFGTNAANAYPSLSVFIAVGLVLIALTAILLQYAARILGLNRAWFLVALAYNALIIVLKFILSPATLYTRNYTIGPGGSSAYLPNNATSYLWIGIFILILYLLAFRILYGHFNQKVLNLINTKKQKNIKHRSVLGAIITLTLVAIIAGIPLLILAVILITQGSDYLSNISQGSGGLLLGAIMSTIGFAWAAFQKAGEKSVAMRNPVLLASFFWLGMSLIFIYHILWFVYLVVLINYWPFKTTYIPVSSSK